MRHLPLHSQTGEYLGKITGKKTRQKRFIKLMILQPCVLFREGGMYYFLLFVTQIKSVTSSSQSSISSFISIRFFKLQQGVLHNCNKTGLPNFILFSYSFFFFVPFFRFSIFTSQISSRSCNFRWYRILSDLTIKKVTCMFWSQKQ